jgi:hypothetical protein
LQEGMPERLQSRNSMWNNVVASVLVDRSQQGCRLNQHTWSAPFSKSIFKQFFFISLLATR